MTAVIEISSTQYDEDIPLIKKALINLESICEAHNGYLISEPVSRFGWTFFKILFHTNLHHSIHQKFSDMIVKAKGSNPDDKFTNFMSDYFESRGCKVRLKLIGA